MAADTKVHRILIVEDEALIAMQLESSLMGLGHKVEAIVTRMDKAVLLARTIDIDFAILDLNVAGIQSFPVADILRGRGISFMSPPGMGRQAL
ncbi:MAG TPA: response regulator [Devosia sp.]|nr:response regulator [Devosia sp.]